MIFGPVAVTTLVDGLGSMDAAAGIAFDATGTMLFVADTSNHQIRSFWTNTGAPASFVIGGIPGFAAGIGTAASLARPFGIAADSNGNLFVSEEGNRCITKIVIATRQTSLLAGGVSAGAADGTGTNAQFSSPEGIVVRTSVTLLPAYCAGGDTVLILTKQLRATISDLLMRFLSTHTTAQI